MFECSYKYELEDSLICSKYVFKAQKRKRDKVIAVMIPILLVAMVAMLIFNIVNGESYVWEIIMLVALLVLEGLYLLIPVMLVRSQKKSFYAQKLDQMDKLVITIENNVCVEKLFKDEQEQARNVHNLRNLTSYLEDGSRLILVFNQAEFVCIKKDKLTGGLDKLKAHLNKTMSKPNKK